MSSEDNLDVLITNEEEIVDETNPSLITRKYIQIDKKTGKKIQVTKRFKKVINKKK